MKKRFIKIIGVLFFALLAIGIIFFGYQESNKKELQQRADFAEAAVPSEANKLKKITTKVQALYSDKAQNFLNNKTSTESVEALKVEVQAIKATPQAYGITEKVALPRLQTLADNKQKIQEQLEQIATKLTIQENLSPLFLSPITEWEEVTDEVIAASVTSQKIEEITTTLETLPDSQWHKNISAYLSQAKEQFDQVKAIKQTLSDYLSKENPIKYEDYATLLENINSISNEELRNDLSNQLDQVENELGIA